MLNINNLRNFYVAFLFLPSKFFPREAQKRPRAFLFLTQPANSNILKKL